MIKIHGVMTIYLYKIISNFCHAYRVNCLKESVRNWSVVTLTIVGVLFGDLKEIKIMTTKIQRKTNSV